MKALDRFDLVAIATVADTVLFMASMVIMTICKVSYMSNGEIYTTPVGTVAVIMFAVSIIAPMIALFAIDLFADFENK